MPRMSNDWDYVAASWTARGRNLMLQDHGDPVWYRGFKLRTLASG